MPQFRASTERIWGMEEHGLNIYCKELLAAWFALQCSLNNISKRIAINSFEQHTVMLELELLK